MEAINEVQEFEKISYFWGDRTNFYWELEETGLDPVEMCRSSWYVYLELVREVPVLPTVQVRKGKSSDPRKHHPKVSEILIKQNLMQEKGQPQIWEV